MWTYRISKDWNEWQYNTIIINERGISTNY